MFTGLQEQPNQCISFVIDFDECADGCSDPMIFIGRGLGMKARRNALRECRKSDSKYVARIDCAEGLVPE